MLVRARGCPHDPNAVAPRDGGSLCAPRRVLTALHVTPRAVERKTGWLEDPDATRELQPRPSTRRPRPRLVSPASNVF